MGSTAMDAEDKRKLKKIMQMAELIYRETCVLVAPIIVQRIKGVIHCGRYSMGYFLVQQNYHEGEVYPKENSS